MRASTLVLIAVCAGCAESARDASTPYGGGVPVPGVAVPPIPDSMFPRTPFGAAAVRGRAILAATGDSLPAFVGSSLRCTSCHLDDGLRPYSIPLTGAHARYPQYRARSADIRSVEDRINECLERSLGGKSLPPDDERLRAIEAYVAFISLGVAVGDDTPGSGIDSVEATTPNPAAGKEIYGAECARCHGPDGMGTPLATPLWGDNSYTLGAGMARYFMAAGFIRANMPFDKPGSLTDQQALDVAAYINAQARREFAGREKDWPKGGAPVDMPKKRS